MTPIGSRHPHRERSTLVRILSSPKTTLVLGIFAFLSIVYYKVYVAPPDEDPKKKPQVTQGTEPDDRPLLQKQEILGRVRDEGPLLTRSFFHTGDIVITGTANDRRWGIVLASPQTITLVHPWNASQPLLPWLRKHGGRFALFRTLATPAVRKTLQPKIAALRRDKPLSPQERRTLQRQWAQHLTAGKAKGTSAQQSSPSPAQWVTSLYHNTGLRHLPEAPWTTPKATQLWLDQLIAKSHYSDLKDV